MKYYDSFTKKNNTYIIMELCDNMDLRKFINTYKEKKEIIPKEVILMMLYDICVGL